MTLEEFDELNTPAKRKYLNMYSKENLIKKVIIGFIVFVLIIMGGCPVYNVWEQDLVGQASLAKAKQDRQIRIEEASAKEAAAVHEKQAEITRAEGVDEATIIIAGRLGGPEGYLRYLYIDAMKESKCTIAYIATEAGMPIMEASRFQKLNQ